MWLDLDQMNFCEGLFSDVLFPLLFLGMRRGLSGSWVGVSHIKSHTGGKYLCKCANQEYGPVLRIPHK